MVFDLASWQMWLAVAAVALGAFVQGSVGFGSALVAAPLLALLDERFVPTPIIMASATLTVLVSLREWRQVNVRAVGWVIVGRVPGTLCGVLSLSYLPAEQLGIAFSLLVLGAVGMLFMGKAPSRTPVTLLVTGVVSGLMGTVTSIGGPPVALLFHDARGPELRGTLGGYFIVSTSMSLLALAGAGLVRAEHIRAYCLLLPGVLLGLWASTYSRGYLDRGRTRTAVLWLSAVTAVAVLCKYL